MTATEQHEGGCHCGKVRYRTTGQPAKTAVCHCRYCQLRSGSAFGVSVYFPDAAVAHLSGALTDYAFTTESGRPFTTRFCPTCGTTVFWTLGAFPGLTGVAGGTFDPPTFWYEVGREVFARSRAPFARTDIAECFDTSAGYAPVAAERSRLDGG